MVIKPEIEEMLTFVSVVGISASPTAQKCSFSVWLVEITNLLAQRACKMKVIDFFFHFRFVNKPVVLTTVTCDHNLPGHKLIYQCCLKLCSFLFQLYRSGQCTYPCLEFFLTVLCTIFFQSHWLLSHITIVETMDSGERGMNYDAMTIIIPLKDYWPIPWIEPTTSFS